jgi:hypothetical protein
VLYVPSPPCLQVWSGLSSYHQQQQMNERTKWKFLACRDENLTFLSSYRNAHQYQVACQNTLVPAVRVSQQRNACSQKSAACPCAPSANARVDGTVDMARRMRSADIGTAAQADGICARAASFCAAQQTDCIDDNQFFRVSNYLYILLQQYDI